MSKRKNVALKKKLIDIYVQYSNSVESYAVLFVKKYLKEADNMWVEILETHTPYYYNPSALQFKTVKCKLFPKTIEPIYPPKSKSMNEEQYTMLCRAITWETANKDIKKQQNQGIQGEEYIIVGTYYQLKKSKGSFFVSDAPPEIKALEKNLNDRTDPLWDIALSYMNPKYKSKGHYAYTIKTIKQLHNP